MVTVKEVSAEEAPSPAEGCTRLQEGSAVSARQNPPGPPWNETATGQKAKVGQVPELRRSAAFRSK